MVSAGSNAPRPAADSMTAEQYFPWRDAQADEQRYELVDGCPVAMSPERVRHAEVKGEIFAAFRTAIESTGLSCRAMIDGVQVKIDERNVFEPDVLIYCGERPSGDDVAIDDPIVVVEVLSPGTKSVDTGLKFRGYFRLASVRHYLVVHPNEASVVHHRREDDGRIASRDITDGDLELDPPGLSVPIAAFYA